MRIKASKRSCEEISEVAAVLKLAEGGVDTKKLFDIGCAGGCEYDGMLVAGGGAVPFLFEAAGAES